MYLSYIYNNHISYLNNETSLTNNTCIHLLHDGKGEMRIYSPNQNSDLVYPVFKYIYGPYIGLNNSWINCVMRKAIPLHQTTLTLRRCLHEMSVHKYTGFR